MKKLDNILCEYCKKEFKPRSRIQRFCSHKCSGGSLKKPKDIQCKICNKVFETGWNSKKNRNAKYCSSKCYGEDLKNKPKKADNERLILNKVCKHCKKEYIVFNYRKDSKFCSMECFDNYRRDTLICKGCGISFKAPKWEKRKYCSPQCNSSYNIQSISKGEMELRNILKLDFPLIENNKIFIFENARYSMDIILGNKIIEFYGDYFHCNPKFFKEAFFNKTLKIKASEKWKRDEIKNNIFLEKGFIILIVWEYDFNNNKDEVIKRCKDFLNQELDQLH